MFLVLNNINAQLKPTGDLSCKYFLSKSHSGKLLCYCVEFVFIFEEIISYSDDYLISKNNEEIPELPSSKLIGYGSIKSNLDKLKDKVTSINIPFEISSFENEAPDGTHLVSSDLQIRRASIHQLSKHIQEFNIHIEDYRTLKNDLINFRTRVRGVNTSLEILGKALYDAWKKSGHGWTQLSTVFGNNVYQVEVNILPKIGNINAILLKKTEGLQNFIELKKTEIRNIQNTTLTIFIPAEKEFLQSKLDSLDNQLSEFEIKKNNFNLMQEQSLKMRELIENNEKEYKRLQKVIHEKGEEIKKSKIKYNEDLNKLSELKKKLNNFTYTYCENPKKFPFDKCTHNSQKNRFLNEQNSMKNEIKEQTNKLRGKSKSIKKRQRLLTQSSTSIQSKFQKLIRAKQKWQQKNDKLILMQNKLVEEFSPLIQQKYDIHQLMSQNETDFEIISVLN